jgi:hypothetical protein
MILIVDFGSQYNQLIARRVREHHVYCQIEPPDLPLEKIRALNPEGIILSGGPASIYESGSPKADPGIFKLGIPVLGICYGLHHRHDAQHPGRRGGGPETALLRPPVPPRGRSHPGREADAGQFPLRRLPL